MVNRFTLLLHLSCKKHFVLPRRFRSVSAEAVQTPYLENSSNRVPLWASVLRLRLPQGGRGLVPVRRAVGEHLGHGAAPARADAEAEGR